MNKVYHTPTQEDYNVLMVELEKQGYEWDGEIKPTESKGYWGTYEQETCVTLLKNKILCFGVYDVIKEQGYEITEYKASKEETAIGEKEMSKKYTVTCNQGEYAEGIFDTEESAERYRAIRILQDEPSLSDATEDDILSGNADIEDILEYDVDGYYSVLSIDLLEQEG